MDPSKEERGTKREERAEAVEEELRGRWKGDDGRSKEGGGVGGGKRWREESRDSRGEERCSESAGPLNASDECGGGDCDRKIEACSSPDCCGGGGTPGVERVESIVPRGGLSEKKATMTSDEGREDRREALEGARISSRASFVQHRVASECGGADLPIKSRARFGSDVVGSWVRCFFDGGHSFVDTVLMVGLALGLSGMLVALLMRE
eukprot:TRINITY_DN9132_c0_g1_i1.p2 TRINITY_DN9132_c0_g1~~TRINITY_DN9132_c0_g1_i1.p2  ORF type:complete len:218 (-),score=32.58 TRINITY_DN9132_c0_g1_i1:35-655(-)